MEKDNVTLQRELNQAKNETSMHQRKIMQLMSELNSLKRVIASSGLPTPDNQTLSYDSSARASPQPETFKQEPISPDSRLMDDHLSYGTMSPPHSHLNPNIVLHSPEYEADDGFGGCDMSSGSGLAQHPAAVLCDLQCQPDFEIQPRPPPRSPLIQTVFDQAQLLSDDLLSRASSLLSPLTRIGSSSRPPPLQATSACTNTMTMSLLSPLRTPPFSMNW